MMNYPGYNRFHPHSNEAIRGHERDGLQHTISRSGDPNKGYRAEMSEGNKMPPRDNKISGMPPHRAYSYGINQDSKGSGMVRAGENSGGQSPHKGGMPKHGSVNPKGVR